MIDTTEANRRWSELNRPLTGTAAERVAARRERDKAIAKIDEQWAEWLAQEHLGTVPATTRPALAKLVYEKAYADGHHAGYSEIEGHYQELAEFVVKARAL